MCLGIPGRVTEIRTVGDLLFARVDFAGAVKDVCLAYVPEAAVGDYVIVHVGFAISRVDEAEARRTLELFAVMGDLVAQELASDVEPEPEPEPRR